MFGLIMFSVVTLIGVMPWNLENEAQSRIEEFVDLMDIEEKERMEAVLIQENSVEHFVDEQTAKKAKDQLDVELDSFKADAKLFTDGGDDFAEIALKGELERANNQIESLLVYRERADALNGKLCDELLAKKSVEDDLELAKEEIRILEKKLDGFMADLKKANKKLSDMKNLEEYTEKADQEIWKLLTELDTVQAEKKKVINENMFEKQALQTELETAEEEMERLYTKVDVLRAENSKLKTELLDKNDLVRDLDFAEEEMKKLWTEMGGVKAENRRIKLELDNNRGLADKLILAEEKNHKLEEEVRRLTYLAEEFEAREKKYQEMTEDKINLEIKLNAKNNAISQLVEGLSQKYPELKDFYHKTSSGEEALDLIWDDQLNRFTCQERRR